MAPADVDTLGADGADELDARCAGIELLVLDVDGVLTDGTIIVDDAGVESKHFYVRDGGGIAVWRRAGKRVAILSGRRAACVDRRAAELGISPVVQGTPRKREPLLEIMADAGVEPRQVAYMGDDLPDLAAFALVGLAACPADAVPQVKAAAHFRASVPGGRGAVRELIERILMRQGLWHDAVRRTYDEA